MSESVPCEHFAKKNEKGLQSEDHNPLKLLVRPAGFEPAAYGFEVRRSIQLSYGRILKPLVNIFQEFKLLKQDGVSDGI